MIRQEPVLTSSLVIGLVTAFLAMCVSMGWLELSDEQMTAVLGFVSATVVVAGIIVRQYVTPWFGDK